ncbi:hypothetical protein [Streptomyces sp. bgisy153]|uniref:hypothetical protein n=1 Tax=Streptomyces sp. bgisy153 TaxID=3413793 RepID=UPI003D764AB5
MSAQFTEGQYVSWDSRDGTRTVQLTVVGRFRITYRDTDDIWDSVESTVLSTLAEKTADWREATAEEMASFKARFRSAPQNDN